MRVAVGAVRDAGEGAGDVRVQRRVEAEVELVAVGVAVGAGGVAALGAAGDEHLAAAAGSLERDGGRDGVLVDALVRRAREAAGRVGAAAVAVGLDGRRRELGVGLGLCELGLRRDDGRRGKGEDGGGELEFKSARGFHWMAGCFVRASWGRLGLTFMMMVYWRRGG